MRTAYEWETKTNEKAIKINNVLRIKKEIKRITETTLRGNFTNQDDKKYWIEKLKNLNSQLLYFEQL